MREEAPELPKMNPTGKIDRTPVWVEWCDAQSHSGWRHESDLNDKYELPIVHTFGFIVQETDKYIAIAQNMIFYEDVSNQVCNLMSIPRDWVIKIHKVRKNGIYVSKSN